MEDINRVKGVVYFQLQHSLSQEFSSNFESLFSDSSIKTYNKYVDEIEGVKELFGNEPPLYSTMLTNDFVVINSFNKENEQISVYIFWSSEEELSDLCSNVVSHINKKIKEKWKSSGRCCFKFKKFEVPQNLNLIIYPASRDGSQVDTDEGNKIRNLVIKKVPSRSNLELIINLVAFLISIILVLSSNLPWSEGGLSIFPFLLAVIYNFNEFYKDRKTLRLSVTNFQIIEKSEELKAEISSDDDTNLTVPNIEVESEV
ncbi:TPA: hypothetical protein U0K61_001389 [Streptococcus suis]|nr:hypothetical protein [Streptococcus suis]HEL9630236.1 hypothetical protein [Streptococcus suis]